MAMLSIDFCASELESQVQLKRPKRPRSCVGSKAHVEIVRAESEVLRNSKRWGEMKPSHLVALWVWLYQQVYGVAPEPAEVSPKAYSTATLFAGRLLKDSFGGDAARMVGFMRWTWARELKMKRARPDGRRIGARLMFSAALVGDWRLATAGRIA
jgi:hypothetical protein